MYYSSKKRPQIFFKYSVIAFDQKQIKLVKIKCGSHGYRQWRMRARWMKLVVL